MVTDEARVLRNALVDWLQEHGACRDAAVVRATRSVERHLFVPEVTMAEAYANDAIVIKREGGRPISSISQPFIVVEMLGMLQASAGDSVLEIGAGSGYNAALLAEIVGASGRVTTVEVDPELAIRAERATRASGCRNITVIVGDGRLGCRELGPFDGVIVTAGTSVIEQRWIDQLKEGGRLVVPITPERRAVAYVKRAGRLIELASTSAGFLPLR